MMTFLTDTIGAYLVMSVFGTIGFLCFLNFIRVYRYGKLVYRIWPGEEGNDKAFAKSSLFPGIFLNIFYTIFLFAHPLPLGYLLAGLWVGFQIAFFYWYWHTKEDPLNRFHYEQKIWEDPRDKKKKEAK